MTMDRDREERSEDRRGREEQRIREEEASTLRPHDEVKFVVGSEDDWRFSLDVIRRHRLAGRVTDVTAFLADLGLPDRALDRLLRAAYELLGLISFFTAGDDECRAWSITAGTTAVKAAGVIHSDFERGFIRAEIVPWGELLEAGSFAACRPRGTLRLEGKDYEVRDGDVITFRFNV